MNRIFTLTIAVFFLATDLQAATTYNITSGTSWSSYMPSYCNNCIINVSSDVTLGLNSGMCNNCTFSGGTLNVTGGFSFQSSSISNTTINVTSSFNMWNSNSLNNVILNMTSGSVSPGLLTVNNSTITLNNTASITGNGQLDLDGSIVYLNDNTHLLANAAVNLKNGSKIIVGDGSKTSKAYFYANSSVNLKDASSYVIISNTSNYFYSWSGFTAPGHTYSTVINYNPKYMGSAVLSSTGILPITVLPIMIGNVKGTVTGGNSVKLSWTLTDASGRETMQIEHSTDATHFTTVTSVAINGSDGGYTYTDESPESGENDYRIKLTGADGAISYSKIISIKITATASSLRVFPNPCSGGNFQIRFPAVQSAMIRVFTLDGKLLYMNAVNGQSQYAVNVPATGETRILVVQIITKEKTSSFNLVNAR